jgi:hypothetical protein
MSIDTTIPVALDPADSLLVAVHTAGDQQIAAARRIAAERDIALRQVAAYERRIAELEHECRELRKANESWQALARRNAPTQPLPRVGAEPEPVVRTRSRRRGRHQ